MATFGSATKNNLPTSFKFSYDGTPNGWGTRLNTIADLTNQADPVDNKLRISDMRVSFIDTDATIWTALGNGTAAFGKNISGTVFVGGSMGPVGDDLGTRHKKVSDVGAYTNAFFTGKIESVSKKDNIVSISAKNLMNLLPLVEWQFPVNRTDEFTQGSFYSKYSFGVDNGESTWGSLVKHAGFNIEDGTRSADFYAFPTGSGIDSSYASGVTGIYDNLQGTGILNDLVSPDAFLNDQFYRDFNSLKFKGTFLGTKRGTISETNTAREYGWDGLDESEPHVATDAEGTFYVVNKMRFQWPIEDADESRPSLYYRSMLRMEGDPTAILRHLLFGKMVTSYYDQTLNMGTDTFYAAAKVTAFKAYNQIINPNDTKVLPYINDLLKTESALFYASSINQFNFKPYGPRDFRATLDSIGTAEIMDSGYSNNLNDAYNHFIVNYGYNFATGEYASKSYGTLPGWSIQNDVPLEIESKWLKNKNQAKITVARQLARYRETLPKVGFTTSLKYAQMEIGTLVTISDPDSGLSGKVIQITDYHKSFGNSNKINFSGYDGESLFSVKGYASWEGDNDMDAVVSGTSTSGWGTTISSVGTTLGINEAIYGTQFIWW